MGKLSSLRQGYGWHSCHTFCSCSNTQDKFVMVLAPGHPTSLRYVGQNVHLLAIKLEYTLTVFWLRSALYRDSRLRFASPGQDCASAPNKNSVP